MRGIRGALGLGALVISIAVASHAQELSKELNETVVMIPKKAFLFTAQLETTLYKPDGDGPFPIVIINHGKAPIPPHSQARYRPSSAARYFLQRGYLVAVPMRQGFSRSSGSYVGAGCNVQDNGLAQAEDVQATLDYLATLPYADRTNILVVGQSHGGWTTLAFGTLNYPGIKGLVNFAGGLRQESCAAWEGTLARVAGGFAKGTIVRSLWFYGDNDSFFSPPLFRSMHEAYTANGGKATLIAFGKFRSDAHYLFGSRAGEVIWQGELSNFLRDIGLQHEVVLPKYAGPEPLPSPPPSGFAALEAIDAIPYIMDGGRKGYAIFLTRDLPRAFAISSGGAWAWSNGGEDPVKRALENCKRHAKGDCRLYAVDDSVVWSK
jgi:dienelactone hydrolase